MSAPSNSLPGTTRKKAGRLRAFWARVTEGFELEQLWGQFLSEAKASYGLYSRDVDWDEVRRTSRGPGRIWRSAWALFQAMLMKLSPARRVLLLLAIALLIFQPDIRSEHHEFSIQLGGIGTLILFLLLALELADRVTMKRDLEIAREIQQWLVPEKAPAVPGFDIAFATRPQNTVAGDYYDAFLRPLPDASGTQPLLVVVADVAGKSVPAALLMATFQASLRALSSTLAPLESVVAGLDRYARAHSLDGRRFTTAFLAQINPQTREMRYTNAGHNEPILRRASGRIERLGTGGPPFGLPLFSENEVTYASASVQLQPGDLFFIFTDGLVEAVDDRGEEFGESRLTPLVQFSAVEPAASTLQRVMTDVNTFVGFARQHDDITCLVLRVTA
jgi:serine phosphatase RsbU (regulator of sigma subunit)